MSHKNLLTEEEKNTYILEKKNYNIKLRPFLERCFPCPLPINTANEQEELAELCKDHNVETSADLDRVSASYSTLLAKKSNAPFRKKISSSSSSSGSDIPITNLKELQFRQAKLKEKAQIIQSEYSKKMAEEDCFEIIHILPAETKKSPIFESKGNASNISVSHFTPITSSVATPVVSNSKSTYSRSTNTLALSKVNLSKSFDNKSQAQNNFYKDQEKNHKSRSSTSKSLPSKSLTLSKKKRREEKVAKKAQAAGIFNYCLFFTRSLKILYFVVTFELKLKINQKDLIFF